MAEWLRTLPVSLALSIARHLIAVGSSLPQVACETSQVLFPGGQVVFLGDSPFSPTLRLTRLKMSEIILTDRNYIQIKHFLDTQ